MDDNILLTELKIPIGMLDSRGNIDNFEYIKEKMGGLEYISPKGWRGLGLNVMNKYENNDWLACNGNKNEWAVAYQGININFIKPILLNGFMVGLRQAYMNDDDIYHPGKKVGSGIYLTPKPDLMEKFSMPSEINGKKYKFGLMVRVNPEKIRSPISNTDYYVVNPNANEIRPYRILIKEIK